MKTIYCFIFMVSGWISLLAQSPYFSKTIDYQKGRDMVYSIETDDTGYVLAGTSTDSLTWKAYVFFAHQDKFGNTDFYKIIHDTSSSYFSGIYGGLTRLRNGGYILGGSTMRNSDNDVDALLYRFNNVGDTIFTSR